MHPAKAFPKLKSKAILAPMAGITDVAFRTLCRKYGAGLTYTEFVSSAAMVRGNEKTGRLMQLDPSEKPSAAQIFGSNVKELIDAAKGVEDMFDIIDINCGCPAPKITKQGAGSELLKKPKLIAEIISEVSSAVSKPVTVKIRIGTDEKHINAIEVANIAEDSGAAAITVHGRTAKQGYSGKADWNVIKQVKKSVNIPVIGNGDIDSPEIFKQRLEESGVDAVMIGRAAIGNQFIFKQISDYLKKGSYDAGSRVEDFFGYAKLLEKYPVHFAALKEKAMGFTKGIPGGSAVRQKITVCKDSESLIKAMEELL